LQGFFFTEILTLSLYLDILCTMLILQAQVRDTKGNLEALRKEGKIPAVFYGKKTESTPITLNKSDFLKAWKQAGESSVVTIKSDKFSVDTLIKDVQIDPVTDIPVHVDFYVFEKGKKIDVSVPLEFTGSAPAVKDLGGILVKVLHDLKISADPTHIPHSIEIDVSSLVDFDSKIFAESVKLPSAVVLKELPTEVVAFVSKPREEKEEDAVAPDLSTIEVEKKGKKEEEAPSTEPAQ
jgi:large subunit ribosomal protein L25